MKVPKARRNNLPRKSSPDGVLRRQERRRAAFVPEVSKGGSGSTRCRMPGSGNRRKVGR